MIENETKLMVQIWMLNKIATYYLKYYLVKQDFIVSVCPRDLGIVEFSIKVYYKTALNWNIIRCTWFLLMSRNRRKNIFKINIVMDKDIALVYI